VVANPDRICCLAKYPNQESCYQMNIVSAIIDLLLHQQLSAHAWKP